MTRRICIAVIVLAVGLAAAAANTPRPCSGSEYGALDFWVGTWDVVNEKGELEGHNRIEKVLNGCAIIENWKEVSGSEGKSLFYFEPVSSTWKQVWVTDSGPIKEKSLLKDYTGPGIRFQGELPRRTGKGTYLDRTTLSEEKGGRVRQVIEISLDRGKSWPAEYRWEGIYTRAADSGR